MDGRDGLFAILASRDARHRHQQELLAANAGKALLCLTVIMPGAEKRNALSLTVADASLEALRAAFPGVDIEERDLPTGFEAYLLVPMSPLEAKRLAVRIEDSHPLGRLFDLDVVTPQGPLSRRDIGEAPRRCLLCGREARLCMRSHAHTHDELMVRIREMVEAWNKMVQFETKNTKESVTFAPRDL